MVSAGTIRRIGLHPFLFNSTDFPFSIYLAVAWRKGWSCGLFATSPGPVYFTELSTLWEYQAQVLVAMKPGGRRAGKLGDTSTTADEGPAVLPILL